MLFYSTNGLNYLSIAKGNKSASGEMMSSMPLPYPRVAGYVMYNAKSPEMHAQN
jgi:hypothetical protein